MTALLVIVLVALFLVLATSAFVVSTTRRRRGGPFRRRGEATRRGQRAPEGTDIALTGSELDRALPPASPDLDAAVTEVAEEIAAEAADEIAAEVAEAGPAAAILESPTQARPALRERIGKARLLLGGYFDGIRSRGVDATTFDDLEEALLLADAGVTTTTRVLDDIRAKVNSGAVDKAPEAVLQALRADLEAVFEGDRPELTMGTGAGPTVWLFVGVNGVGKTTTIGKLAARERDGGRRVVLAAADTFRAAAGEQLESWAGRADASIIRGAEGADPSSVVFDAVQHAAAREADLVLADTAGRLHTKVNLMEELRKVRRIAERPPGQLSEVLLVLDATTGQNGLVQAKQFSEAVGVTGIVLTKLDGTAKGGVVLAIRAELGLPIKLVGVGEGPDDLLPFDSAEFVSALFE